MKKRNIYLIACMISAVASINSYAAVIVSDVASSIGVSADGVSLNGYLASLDTAPVGFTMTGGSLSATNTNAGNVIGVYSDSLDAVVNISGGTMNVVESGVGDATLTRMNDHQDSLTISGGTFNATETGDGAIYGIRMIRDGDVTISGGTFNFSQDDSSVGNIFTGGGAAAPLINLSGGLFNNLDQFDTHVSLSDSAHMIIDVLSNTSTGLTYDVNGVIQEAAGTISGTLADGNAFSFVFETLESSQISVIGDLTVDLVTPSELSMYHATGAGSTTGTVDAVHTSSTNLDVTITISDQSDANAFTVVSATPQTLTNETTELAFKFDNTVAALAFGETATGLVTIAWAETGGGASGTNFITLSATVGEKIYGTFITVDDFPVFNLTAYTNTVGGTVQRLRHTGENTTSAGQTFTIPEGSTTTVSRLSVWINSIESFDADSTHEIKLWLGEYTNDTPGAAYAFEFFDMAGKEFGKTHLTFDLTSDVTLPPGDYAFQLAWTTADATHDMTLFRTTDASDYDAGSRLNGAGAELPFAAATTAGSGLRFAIHSRSDAEWVDMGTVFPTGDDIVASMDTTNSANILMRNVSGLGIRVPGQSFALASETTLSAITIQSGADASFNGNSIHELDLWIVGLDDGLSNNVPLWVDAVVLSSETMTNGNFYKIDFSDITLPAGSYGIEVEWVYENSNHILNWKTSDGSVDEYADGYMLYQSGFGVKAPFDETANDKDLIFALHKLVAEVGFDAWIEGFGLVGDDLLPETDVEPDGLDNLMEYALGGNPTNDDAAVVSPKTYTEDDGGTDYFYHFSDQRTDDASLTFTLGATDNLVTTAPDTNDVSFVGESATANNYKTVTNRTEATPSAKFIQLKVQKD
ncbi:autotransporter outer membrane beta-barrel domain-containing protein [Pontiella sulfatireligans]|uniref:Cadherin domain-containing protein n=1 Tax=Pontiella sulfatireligans TaxID=2750658 RepID=A0A6C2UGI2_9BACT|nr:hypothetical protein [Pontiella sulfatireligans]VGO18316.1 hypothetical protein SCARR_00368 [Pontiella sulfatireligans]